MDAVFACTKCNSRHPFEELSPRHQLCKECRGTFRLVKCAFCRTEFLESSKGSTTACVKCEAKVKMYGKPKTCAYCNIDAAFIGTKCQRCTNSEKKHGPPVACEQCKQRCAFDTKGTDGHRKGDKLLCWLCTLSYKRALAKAKLYSSVGQSASVITVTKPIQHQSAQIHKRPHPQNYSCNLKPKATEQHVSVKKPKIEPVTKPTNASLPTTCANILLDPSVSDHVVAITQLKDQIASLQKQLMQRNQQLRSKGKVVSDLKAQHGVLERELRLKIQAMNRSHGYLVDDLQSKVRVMQKQIVTLNKQVKSKGPPPEILQRSLFGRS